MINRLAFFPRASVRQATAMTICKLVFRDETRPMCVCVSLSLLSLGPTYEVGALI